MWSLHAKEGIQYDESNVLIQPFTTEEWNAYPFAGEEKLKWFRDAKLGLFLHVGISALGKVDIGWSRKTHKLPDPGEGPIPDEVYDGWANEIKMEDFDADEWIDLAISGGFKYVVIITKHHDGFHMWDTEYSDYKITNAPMARDYIKELTDACHKKGMPIGLYYSERDWHHPDYEPIDINIVDRAPKPPFYQLKEGCIRRAGKKHRNYITYMHNTVLELMEKYGRIDILWWDASWYKEMFTSDMWDSDTLERKVREKQPHIIINNRAGLPGDFDTPECRIGHVQRDRAWETCMPLGKHWAWTGEELKPFKEIIRQFICTVSGDGNYLISIGCMPNGKIASEESEHIRKLGAFMEKYGSTIYGTRSGPWNPGDFGGSVYRGDTAYIHIVERPKNGILVFPLKHNKVKEIECITDDDVRFVIKDNNLVITVPKIEFEDIIIKVQMAHNIQTSIKGISVENSEVTRSHIADIEIVQIQNKE